MTAQKTGNILPRLGNWSFAGADSKVEIDGALEYLNWEEDSAPGKYICRNASGQWFLEVIATAEVTEIEGRRICYKVCVSDEKGLMGEGTHERFIIDPERFMAKLG